MVGAHLVVNPDMKSLTSHHRCWFQIRRTDSKKGHKNSHFFCGVAIVGFRFCEKKFTSVQQGAPLHGKSRNILFVFSTGGT